MIRNDLQKFNELITDIHNHYKTDCSKFSRGLWLKSLGKFEYEKIEQAFSNHILNSKNGHFLPQISDIVAMLEGDAVGQANAAWDKTILAIKQVGNFESVIFDDAKIHKVIFDLGGWVELCSKTIEQLNFVKLDFIQRYSALVINRRKFNYPAYLQGSGEAQSANFAMPKKIIGNATAAKLVADTANDKKVGTLTEIKPIATEQLGSNI